MSAPASVLLGLQDEGLGSEPVAAWAPATSRGLSSRSFEGGHFYLTDHLPVLTRDVFSRLGHEGAP
jgi:pyochelin biosynthesis protein PchC